MDINRPHNTAAAERRQYKIENCLLEYMQAMPYSQISITEMCRQMDISRRAFYTYFPDKDSCLYALIDRMIRGSMLNVADLPGSGISAYDACRIYFEYWKGHGEFLQLLVKQGFSGLFRERDAQYYSSEGRFLYELLNAPEVKADMDLLDAFTDLRSGMVVRWCVRGFDASVEEIARKYYRLISIPMIHQKGVDHDE